MKGENDSLVSGTMMSFTSQYTMLGHGDEQRMNIKSYVISVAVDYLVKKPIKLHVMMEE